MRFISNRGNTDKRRPWFENKIEYVDAAVVAGYDCKVDVWWRDGEYWLGADAPRYKIPHSYLELDAIWCQAKNIEAFEQMIKNKYIHCFWFNELFDYQNIILTSRNVIWSSEKSTAKYTLDYIWYADTISGVIPHLTGVCADNVKYAREFITEEKAPLSNMNNARDVYDILPENFFNREIT